MPVEILEVPNDMDDSFDKDPELVSTVRFFYYQKIIQLTYNIPVNNPTVSNGKRHGSIIAHNFFLKKISDMHGKFRGFLQDNSEEFKDEGNLTNILYFD